MKKKFNNFLVIKLKKKFSNFRLKEISRELRKELNQVFLELQLSNKASPLCYIKLLNFQAQAKLTQPQIVENFY